MRWRYEAKMAFVLDIRRQNMLLLMLYKALIRDDGQHAQTSCRSYSQEAATEPDAKTNVSALLSRINSSSRTRIPAETVKAIKSVLAKHGFTLSKRRTGGPSIGCTPMF
jgi:hypothetical protein